MTIFLLVNAIDMNVYELGHIYRIELKIINYCFWELIWKREKEMFDRYEEENKFECFLVKWLVW